MVNVLVVGATGYVGRELIQSLTSSGNHQVYGLARTPSKAGFLAAQEVIPIQGTISEDDDSIPTAIEKFQIDTVVDVAGANHGSYSLLNLVKKAAIARRTQYREVNKPKLGFIYCSGTWVHGSSNHLVNDLTPVDTLFAPNPPAKLTSWRPALEREILASSDVLDVIVIRPALIYGRSSSIWSLYFDPLFAATQTTSDAPVKIQANKDDRPGLVHVDDVASGFHCAIDKLSLISGTGVYPIFDLVTSQESLRDIIEYAAREFGIKAPVELTGSQGDLFAEAMGTSFNGSSSRARSILEWAPKRNGGFVSGMGVFVKGWVAGKRSSD